MFTANDFTGPVRAPAPLFTVIQDDGECQQVRCACNYVFTASCAPEENVVFCVESKALHPQCPNCSRTTAVQPEGA